MIICKQAVKNEEVANYEEAIKLYLQAIEISDEGLAMMNLAILYETYHHREPEKIKKYYLKAIETDNCCASMYNYADYCKFQGNYDEMVKYYDLAIREHNDLESVFELILHYREKSDSTNLRKYYLMSLQLGETDDIYEFTTDNKFESFVLLDFVMSATENEVSKINAKNMLAQLNSERNIAIYNNKIKLFTGLNHILECGICYEEKLNINLACGHCVCTCCYKRVYMSSCPFCRICFV